MELSKEFPGIPPKFKDFTVSPNPFDISVKLLTLKNHSKAAVLFKVKCSSNKRIKIEECADILRPGNETTVPISKLVDDIEGDSIYVIYTLVGKQWHDERMSAFRCWERAKKQAIPTKYISIPIKTGTNKNDEKERKEDKKEHKERTRSED